MSNGDTTSVTSQVQHRQMALVRQYSAYSCVTLLYPVAVAGDTTSLQEALRQQMHLMRCHDQAWQSDRGQRLLGTCERTENLTIDKQFAGK